MTNAGRDARRHAAAPKIRRALRLVGWNAVLLVAGLALIGLAGEVWLRSTAPFMSNHQSTVFVPDVGVLLRPDSEVRRTNRLDFWTVSRTNSLGFLDREPISSERAAESCHVTMIGASFVEAWQVPISEKFHVRLEEMAAREVPALDVTTSAFGRDGTGQINQLAFYDAYARHLHPKLVTLVFTSHGFIRNSPVFSRLLEAAWHPDHSPFVSAAKDAGGEIDLRPPHPDYWKYLRLPAESWDRKLRRRIYRMSWFADWLAGKKRLLFPSPDSTLVTWREFLAEHPRYAPLFDGWRPSAQRRLIETLTAAELPPAFKESLEYTAFALDQFKERTERDGASLVILASHVMVERGDRVLHGLNALAQARDIPVIDQYGYILRQCGSYKDAHWAHDAHWNPTGHQWAAEAVLEYLKQHQAVCE